MKRFIGKRATWMACGVCAWVQATALPTQASVDRLAAVRNRIVEVEQGLIHGLRAEREARSNIRKIKLLVELQKQEREIGRKRLQELEGTIVELESRRSMLRAKIVSQQISVRGFLISLQQAAESGPDPLSLGERERIEDARRKVLANLADHGLKEVETLRADFADAERLEARIMDERQQLTFLFEDLKEQDSILALNQKLQLDLLQKNHNERLGQLESYRKLKNSEAQVERLIGEFNSRIELERTLEEERALSQGAFAKLRGKLQLPLPGGKVVANFGRVYDPKSQLYIFKKGIDIAGGKRDDVRAIWSGKVAYSGELPEYGKVTIVDHGDHFYSLCAHLGQITRRKGEEISAGDLLGLTDDHATPVYFEIRARNIAVNPLRWFSN